MNHKKCDECDKYPAIVYYTQIINGKKIELHLCEKCAREKGLNINNPISVSDILAGITDTPASEKKCKGCGLTLAEFKKIGRLGCANCYDAFKDSVLNITRKVQGKDSHVGKFPPELEKEISKDRKVQELRKQLNEAIGLEEYEKAAKIRDQIKKMSSK